MRMEKYQFRHFNDRGLSVAPLSPAQGEASLVSELVLEEARRQSYEAGHAQGVHEGVTLGRQQMAEETEARVATASEAAAAAAVTTHHKQLEMTAGLIAERIETGVAELKSMREAEHGYLTGLALAIAQKLAGKALSAQPMEVIREHLLATLQQLQGEPSVLILVSPLLLDAVEQQAAQQARLAGFRGIMKFEPDESLQPGDCRMEWRHGSAERRTDAIAQQIAQALERHITPPTPQHEA